MKIFSAVVILVFSLITPIFAHEDIKVVNLQNWQNCERYLFDEKLYKNAAKYAYEAEKKYSITLPNTFRFSQKARDARSDYGLCTEGVILRFN